MVAAALDRDPDDLDVQVFARAVVAAIEAALRAWYAQGFAPSLTDLLERALGVLDRGLVLPTPD